jgi:hypothetical protein
MNNKLENKDLIIIAERVKKRRIFAVIGANGMGIADDWYFISEMLKQLVAANVYECPDEESAQNVALYSYISGYLSRNSTQSNVRYPAYLKLNVLFIDNDYHMRERVFGINYMAPFLLVKKEQAPYIEEFKKRVSEKAGY